MEEEIEKLKKELLKCKKVKIIFIIFATLVLIINMYNTFS